MSDSNPRLIVTVGTQNNPATKGQIKDIGAEMGDQFPEHEVITTSHDIDITELPEIDELADRISDLVVTKIEEDEQE